MLRQVTLASVAIKQFSSECIIPYVLFTNYDVTFYGWFPLFPLQKL